MLDFQKRHQYRFFKTREYIEGNKAHLMVNQVLKPLRNTLESSKGFLASESKMSVTWMESMNTCGGGVDGCIYHS